MMMHGQNHIKNKRKYLCRPSSKVVSGLIIHWRPNIISLHEILLKARTNGFIRWRYAHLHSMEVFTLHRKYHLRYMLAIYTLEV